MRALNNSDLFAFVRLVKKAKITDKIKELTLSINNINEINTESFGYDVMFTIIEAAAEKESEQAVYEFLSGPLEMTTEELALADPVETIEKVMQIADVERWKTFFTSAANLMKSKLKTYYLADTEHSISNLN